MKRFEDKMLAEELKTGIKKTFKDNYAPSRRKEMGGDGD